ncbi:MAG: hypothetical protein K2P81_05940 [Bacteriovoracaceae bacterium]|nr:hypothetical protein [Bacteriovoracaceae bacterium]
MLSKLYRYFKTRKKFWLIPLLLIFVIAAVLVLAGPSNPYSPFIYTVF